MQTNYEKKINILQVVNGLAIGGGELKLLELVGALHKQRSEKYNVYVCSIGQGGPLYSRFEDLGVETYVIEKKHKFDVSQIFKLYKLIKKKNIDVVQTTLFYADIIGTIAAKIAGVKSIISWETVSHPEDSVENQFRHKIAYQFCMRYVNKIISVSDAVKSFLTKERNIDPEKIQTIHYGINLAGFKSSNGYINKNKRAELQFSDSDYVIGTVARLTKQKGHKYLVQAAKKIVEQFPSVHFVFVGDGPLREDLEQQIKNLALEKQFHFLGFRKDVSDLLYTFDLFVLPSLFEGLPNVILEAMACGRPVVATAVDGTPELIEDGVSGKLVPPKSPKDLAKEIINILKREDRGAGIGKNARLRVEKYFSFEKQFQEFEEVYNYELGV